MSLQTKCSELESELKSLQRENKNMKREMDYLQEKEEIFQKEISELKATWQKSNLLPLICNQKDGGNSSTYSNTELLQKEAELLKTKLAIKELEEEYTKLETDNVALTKKIAQIKLEYNHKLQTEQNNSKKMVQMVNLEMRNYRLKYEEEIKLLITWLHDAGSKAYMDNQRLKTK